MALYRCSGGGSSELQETVLWTNSSPTSSFANQVVTLSDDINNYDYIKFYFRVSTSNSASQNVMAPVSDFKNLTDASTSNSFVSLSSPNEYTGSYRMVRRLNYESATSVRINTSVRANGQGNDDTLIIPTAISGLKYARAQAGTNTVAIVHPKVGGTDYVIARYVNTWEINKADFGIPESKVLRSVCLQYFSETARTSGNMFSFYTEKSVAPNYYGYAASSSTTGGITTLAYPATSSHRLGYVELSSKVTVSFYEPNTPGNTANADLILTFE